MRNLVTALMQLMNNTIADAGITEVVTEYQESDAAQVLIGYVRRGCFPIQMQVEMIVAKAIQRKQAFRICFDKGKRLEGRVMLMTHLPKANLLVATDREVLSLPEGTEACLKQIGIEVIYLLEPDAQQVEAMRYIHALTRQQSAA